MWKIVVGFIVFAAIALYVIWKGGDNIDMSGEKHGVDAVHSPAPGAAASAATGAATGTGTGTGTGTTKP